MAIAKITGGKSVQVARLYFKNQANRGTKNLVWHNTVSQINRLERDMENSKITEDEFAEQQSDVLTAFVDKWGDPVPPSSETAEEKEERKARKARKKAVEKNWKWHWLLRMFLSSDIQLS